MSYLEQRNNGHPGPCFLWAKYAKMRKKTLLTDIVVCVLLSAEKKQSSVREVIANESKQIMRRVLNNNSAVTELSSCVKSHYFILDFFAILDIS